MENVHLLTNELLLHVLDRANVEAIEVVGDAATTRTTAYVPAAGYGNGTSCAFFVPRERARFGP